jgi:hypothetical protein
MYDVMQYVVPIRSSSKEKGVPDIDGVCVVGGKVALIPIVSSSETVLCNRG